MDDISVDCNFTQIQTLIIDDDVISLWTVAFEIRKVTMAFIRKQTGS